MAKVLHIQVSPMQQLSFSRRAAEETLKKAIAEAEKKAERF
ncbi:MAG TPA: hypothetical protein VMY69_05075 [Phycisphaerae bacterium]|nr:hypothetical protein [Phycisphaerae bacterium]